MKRIKDSARSAFSVIIVGLLITSVIAPAAFAGTAAASDAGHCTDTYITQLVGSVCEWSTDADTVNNSDDREAAYVQADHHAEMRGEYETSEQLRTVFSNYAEDTNTLASLEARNAIATAWQNGKTASTADAKAQTAIQNYYSVKEVNLLEAYTKQQAQLAYSANSTRNHPTAYDKFFYPQVSTESGWSVTNTYYTGALQTRTYTLANGSTHQYKSAVYFVRVDYDSGTQYATGTHSTNITAFKTGTQEQWSNGRTIYYNGMSNVRASYYNTSYNISNGHPAQVITSHDDWGNMLKTFADQSDTVEANYAAGTASDLYTEMDAGRLDPADVRGAEGQVRFLSGDANSTTQRYKAALYGSLNMKQAGYNSTFFVEYTGYTESSYKLGTGGSRTINYSGHVDNKSYEGIIFSSEIPSGGFQPNTTYNTSKLNGTTMIYSKNSGTVTFVKGNLTINKITDENGNVQDSVTWEDPKYDTNNVSEYLDYLNKTQQMQLQLLEQYSAGTSSGSTTSGTTSGWNPTQNQLIGMLLAVVAAAAMAQRGAE